ncbi:MAG TPA: hypothetical protein VFX51_22955, partial [Solirubrobacteraceae bacterium]|nr:hypothetical protein [Solirubrobacteraceae bacterium]
MEAALAGRYVAPEHAELAELALLLRDDRPKPTPAWQNQLDRRVEARFPARPKQRRRWVPNRVRSAAPVLALCAVLAIIVVPVALVGIEGGSSDDSGYSTGAGGGGDASVAAPESAGSGGGASAPAQEDQALSRDSASP